MAIFSLEGWCIWLFLGWIVYVNNGSFDKVWI
jgi:hypothetical protein